MTEQNVPSEIEPPLRFEQNSKKNQTITIILFSCKFALIIELVSKELNHFGVIAGLFRQIGGHNSRFVLFCSF